MRWSHARVSAWLYGVWWPHKPGLGHRGAEVVELAEQPHAAALHTARPLSPRQAASCRRRRRRRGVFRGWSVLIDHRVRRLRLPPRPRREGGQVHLEARLRRWPHRRLHFGYRRRCCRICHRCRIVASGSGSHDLSARPGRQGRGVKAETNDAGVAIIDNCPCIGAFIPVAAAPPACRPWHCCCCCCCFRS